MKKLTPYFKGSRIQCVLAPLFKMLEATLELIVPLIIKELIDTGISQNDKTYIIKLSIQLVILGLIGLVFSITAQYFAANTAVSFVKRLKHSLFSKIQSLSFTQYDNNGTATLITRMTSDMDSVQNGINLTLRLLLRSPFVVFGACIMAFSINKKLSSIFAIAVILLSIVIFGIMLVTIPLNKKIRSSLDSLLLTTRESITGSRVIRAFNNEDKQVKEFEAKNNSLTLIQEKTGKISALMNPVTGLIINTSIAVLIYFGAKNVFAGYITCGTVVALYNYMSQILVELIKLANLIVTLTKSVACADRIAALMDLSPDEIINQISKADNSGYIVFDNVSFAYSGAGEESLKNVNFTINKGEKVGIIGSTGSGKSTLVDLIAGFYRPTNGHIYIDGIDTSTLTQEEISRKIAFVEQKPVIFKGTVRSNMLIGNQKASDEEILNSLECAQAKDFVLNKENGIDAVTEQNGRNFSGGQRQRLAVARALVKKSDVLILDDASSALDYMTDSQMRNAISKLNYNAVFTVSQRTGSIMNSDKIILLEDGCATVGTHNELLESNDVYREIHFSQFEEEDAI